MSAIFASIMSNRYCISNLISVKCLSFLINTNSYNSKGHDKLQIIFDLHTFKINFKVLYNSDILVDN